MPTHVVYIDDSGTKEYASSPNDYGDGPSRYFVFGGVIVTIEEAGILSSKIIDLKLKYFGTDAVEIKSTWLRIPKERKKHYLDVYELNDEQLNEFSEHFYNAITTSDLLFIASVIDKIEMQQRYPVPWYPPAIAYELLLQRVEYEVQGKGDYSVIIDDMTGKTPRGNEYKENLKKQHTRLKKVGSSLINGLTFKCAPSRLKFVNSAYSHMIQVADIAAYNVYRQFVDHGADWENPKLRKLPTYQYFNRIGKKFRKGPDGTIQGFGIIKYPSQGRIPWAYSK